MWPFSSKRTREAKHRQLLVFARNALDTLGVKPYKSSEGIAEPDWDPTRVPLEFRRSIALFLGTLVFFVHDESGPSHIGDNDALRELEEALSFVQRYLSGAISDASRAVFRAAAFSEVAETVSKLVADTAEDVALGEFAFVRMSLPRINDVTATAKEALAWFKSQGELDQANALRSKLEGKRCSTSLHELAERLDKLQKLRDRVARKDDDQSSSKLDPG